jgi:hypothetical protein
MLKAGILLFPRRIRRSSVGFTFAGLTFFGSLAGQVKLSLPRPIGFVFLRLP